MIFSAENYASYAKKTVRVRFFRHGVYLFLLCNKVHLLTYLLTYLKYANISQTQTLSIVMQVYKYSVQYGVGCSTNLDGGVEGGCY